MNNYTTTTHQRYRTRKKFKMIIENKYQYVVRKIGESDDGEPEFEDWTAIGITKGRYEGVIYKYGKVSVPEEENEDGTLPLRFEYDIIDTNNHPEEDFKEDFDGLIGDILVDILDKELNIDNDRTDST